MHILNDSSLETFFFMTIDNFNVFVDRILISILKQLKSYHSILIFNVSVNALLDGCGYICVNKLFVLSDGVRKI